ncbi:MULTISPECIES: lytic murein transglycosylase [unclassified Methylobacterium]|uniref:lytic murein transglycosylase n=1 Tax=unclassified Methylobacterium TaxID=2615210 RepID=UPI0036F51F7D
MRAGLAGLVLALLAASPAAVGPARAQDTDFSGFVDALRSDAKSRGISQATFAAAFAGVSAPDPEVIARTRRQGEFSRPVWDYLVGAVSNARIARGQAQGKRLAATLAAIEGKTGVPRAIVLAFWGVESDFGASAGSLSVVRALASLAYARHRGTLFRDELWAALQILENGDIEPARMVGSWAGAMGQVQFLPSVYLREAVDFDGDGRRDIWRSEADSLASIAHYLRSLGWKPGLSWGYEVSLPKEFDLTRYRGPIPDFAARGVRRTDGKPLPANGEASLFLPGGLGSPVFLITDNFEVIRGYNTSDSYALAVGHLADRLAGGLPLAAPWPSGAARLDGPGLKRLQAGLAAKGLYAGEQDGRAGPKLREAVRQYQIREGLPADGYARPALLERVEGRP